MNVKKLVSQMTLEEKAGLCSGSDFWHTKALQRLGIPEIMMSDGPHGLRKQEQETDNLGIGGSIEAVCFPAACATACSFDRALLQELGCALGQECQAEQVDLLLGPGVTIKRSPLCGRNFEYFSEDPYLSSQLGAAYIQGVQSQGIGTSLKHYLANNQEHRRLCVSAEVDDRALREIYLASFEAAVRVGKPWTVMCSYNRVNGVYASENEWSLTEILRNEWGFDGVAVSDWGAVNDRVEGVRAGLDLEMPGSGGGNDEKLVRAVLGGQLEEAVLDCAAERILTLVDKAVKNRRRGASYSKEEHHELARRIETESIVLLQNKGVLPLKKEQKLAFIGSFAETPRFQGGGSSHINAFKIESALKAAHAAGLLVEYAPGFGLDEDEKDDRLLKQAVQTASKADAAIIFAGLPDSFESEGYDRIHMDLPDCQNRLILEVCRAQPNTVVVLHNGSPVVMPWAEKAGAVLEAYLGGQAVGPAVIDVLLGMVNPSGKLAETFPKKLSDNPSFLNFPGEGDRVEYREGIFVGYRYYDKKQMDVLFPFGHGLSYTTFSYSNARVSAPTMRDTDTLTVTVTVANTGAVFGKEAVQLYVRGSNGRVIRPEKELKGFEKVALAPGESKAVSFTLDKRAFAFWDVEQCGWRVETGNYDLLIGRSSRDIALTLKVLVESTSHVPARFTLNSTVGDLMENPAGSEAVREIARQYFMLSQDTPQEQLDAMARGVHDLPLRALVSFSKGKVSEKELIRMLERLNQNAV